MYILLLCDILIIPIFSSKELNLNDNQIKMRGEKVMEIASFFKSVLLVVAACIFFFALASGDSLENNSIIICKEDKVAIATLYDNYQYSEGLKTDWGFSALILIDNNAILFDAGTNGSILLENIDKLGLEPKNVDALLLSHDHGDHTNGLDQFLKKWGAKKVYIPKSFAHGFKNTVGQNAELVEVTEAIEILPHIFTTGEMGTAIIEQGLIIETTKGLVIITGCAHPGIVDIVKKAKELRKKDIYLVMGGFHLMNKSDKEMAEIIKAFRALGVKKVSPTHCTGDRQIELFKKEYGEDFIKNGVGKKLIMQE